jgi:hypothetical protein
MKYYKNLMTIFALSLGLVSPGLSCAGDFSLYHKQMTSIAEVIIIANFIKKGRCDSIKQCQLDGFVKYSSSKIYVYGIKEVDEAISIVDLALRQQNHEKLTDFEIVVFQGADKRFDKKRDVSPRVIMRVESAIGF